MKHVSKVRKLELEITAIGLWFQTFGHPGMSSPEDRLHMSELLNKLTSKLTPKK